jgi:hypothetical protein
LPNLSLIIGIAEPEEMIWISELEKFDPGVWYPEIKMGLANLANPMNFTGAGTGGRTPGLLITNQLLYH